MNKNSNLLVLICLGIIWSTFAMFTKISVEALSPYFISFARLVLGGSLLICVCLIRRKKVFIAKNFKFYAIVGLFNSAIPFSLFALSAQHLDSGVMAILDGTIPMFEVIISIFFLKRYVDKNAIWGVSLGIAGIIATSYGKQTSFNLDPNHLIAIAEILIATTLYAAMSLYINAKCKSIDSMAMATGSVIFATLFLSPSLFFVDLSVIDAKVAGSLFGLGFLCTGIAYILFFKLAAEESSRTAVSTVLLIPVFGTIFGAIFLGELITPNKIIGGVAILVSMKFILNLSKKNFFPVKTAPMV